LDTDHDQIRRIVANQFALLYKLAIELTADQNQLRAYEAAVARLLTSPSRRPPHLHPVR